MSIELGFSAQTSSMQTQDIIDGKLDKIRKGEYGPKPQEHCILFVDDLNMPTK
jgi:dynein heavy chain